MMQFQDLVEDRPERGTFRVHRSAMTSAAVFEAERRHIFERSWNYIGHESEVPDAGDYRRRSAAGKPLFMVRGKDGIVRVFQNTCTHRGALVCRNDDGRASAFQCFYHGWTFDTYGRLIGVPEEEAYRQPFDRNALGLAPVRVEHYRGFYFVTFDAALEPLTAYLEGVRGLMDLTLDCAEPLGGWTIMRGCAKYSIKANWKLLVENSADGYHLQTVHQTYLDYIAWRRAQAGKSTKRPPLISKGLALEGGHGAMVSIDRARPIATPNPDWSDSINADVARVLAENLARFGEERGREMCETSRHLSIFPNLAFQDTSTGFRLRHIVPVTPDLIDVFQWDFVPRNESAELHALRTQLSLAFLGPGGLATPDDVEALESCQAGFAADGVQWSDVSRGIDGEPSMTGELQIRSFWRKWAQLLGRAALTPA